MNNRRVRAIRELGAILSAYNESGEDVVLMDSDGEMVLPADPECSRSLAAQVLSSADCEAMRVRGRKGRGKK